MGYVRAKLKKDRSVAERGKELFRSQSSCVMGNPSEYGITYKAEGLPVSLSRQVQRACRGVVGTASYRVNNNLRRPDATVRFLQSAKSAR
jgi:hypothetical protein